MKTDAKRWWMILTGIGMFVLFAYIFYQDPYCHDEWAWGLPNRIKMLRNGFDGYNGRYAGNVLAILITRYTVAKVLIPASFIMILFFALLKICGLDARESIQKKAVLMCFTVLLLLAVPRTLFRQTYGWLAAFVNFIPPVALFLVIYYETEKAFLYGNGELRMPVCIGLMPVCLISQMFSEHNTIFHVLYMLFMVCRAKIRFNRFSKTYLMMLFSDLLGAVLMFSNSAYHNAVSDTDGYKHITFSLRSFFEVYVNTMSDHLLLHNWILNGIIAGVLSIMLIRRIMHIRDIGNRVLAVELITVLAGYAAFGVLYRVNPNIRFSADELGNNTIRAILGLFFYLHVCGSIILVISGHERIRICLLYLSAMIIAGPLLVASPIGERCFFASYVFQMMTAVSLLQYIMPADKSYRLPLLVLAAACVVTASCYGYIFTVIGRYNHERMRLINEAKERELKEIQLPYLPYTDYFWITEPPTSTWAKRFNRFYGLDKDVDVSFVSVDL